MRIGIFGNTNNYPLLLARALRGLGHDAVLVVNRRERLHRPESKYPELADRYPEWIRDCSHLAEDEFIALTPHVDDIVEFLARGSDAVILNDIGPSLLEAIGDVPALALMTGSDLTYYADRLTPDAMQRAWDHDFAASPTGRLCTKRWREFVERQRAGLRAAHAVSAPLPGLVPEIDALLGDIAVDAGRRTFLYMADVERAAPAAPPDRRRLRIVNGARLNWKKPLPPAFSTLDHKGTDVLLEGFAQFIAAGGDAELVLFRKGLHVEETHALAIELGIGDRLEWLDETSLDAFSRELAAADIVCDQLGDSFPGMVALDAMAMGRPVIANFRPELMAPFLDISTAACQARTPSEIASHLLRLSSTAWRHEVGEQARRFAFRHLTPTAAAVQCLARLGLLSSRDRLLLDLRQRTANHGDAEDAAIDIERLASARHWSAVRLDAAHIRRDIGHGWMWRTPTRFPAGDEHGGRSAVTLLEGTFPLGPAHALHDAIRARGAGSYSHWDGIVYFSTSDNSDPRANGRSYTALIPGEDAR